MSEDDGTKSVKVSVTGMEMKADVASVGIKLAYERALDRAVAATQSAQANNYPEIAQSASEIRTMIDDYVHQVFADTPKLVVEPDSSFFSSKIAELESKATYVGFEPTHTGKCHAEHEARMAKARNWHERTISYAVLLACSLEKLTTFMEKGK